MQKDSADGNKQFWQKVSKIYAPFMRNSDRLYDGIGDRIRPYLNRNMDILELACGTGQLSFRLGSRVRLWEATDFSENMIAEAKKQGRSSRLHFSVQDATKLPYTEDSFDAVLISNALHIMPHPEKALEEIQRVLKPGGLLFAPTFIHGEGTGFRLRVRLMELVGFKTYYKWSAEEFVQYIEKCGFSVLEQKIMGGSLTPLCCLIGKNAAK